jgi:hypothetical protein
MLVFLYRVYYVFAVPTRFTVYRVYYVFAAPIYFTIYRNL